MFIEVFEDSLRVPSYLGLKTGVDSVTMVAVDVDGVAAGVAKADGVVCGVLKLWLLGLILGRVLRSLLGETTACLFGIFEFQKR